jgi:threonine dehydrogenase-like Zn-dependent dehydrogenase
VRAVRHTSDGVVAVDVPEPEGEGVIVHVRAAGICGSDINALAYGPSPVTPGHEFGGVLGDGTRVAVSPNRSCGACAPCGRGDSHLCVRAISLLHGIGIDGGMAERVLVDPANLLPLPANLPDEALALVEPISIAVHGLHRASAAEGMRALVVGAGSIGLGAVLAAGWMGVDVDVAARHPHQRDAADALGGRLSVGDEYDLVIDTVGSQAALDESLQRARAGGTVLALGGWATPVQVGVVPMLKEINLVSAILCAHHHDSWEFEQAAEVITRFPDACSVIVTHRFPLDRAAEAFAVAADKSTGAIKVHLHP